LLRPKNAAGLSKPEWQESNVTHPELPHNIDAEKAVLGSVLLNRDALASVAPTLTPDMFYMERHADIYAVMLDLFSQRTPADTRTVSAELKRRGKLDSVGGVPYISDLIDSIPTSYHIGYYAQFVKDAAFHRSVIKLGATLAARGYDTATSADDLRADALKLVTDAVAQDGQAAGSTLDTLMRDLMDGFTRDHPPAISTGLSDLDEIIYGIRKERLITIAGRPGHGKSALALTIACNVVKQGHAGLFFSMEMSQEELSQRILSMHSGIDGAAIQAYRLDEREIAAATDVALQVSSWPLTVHCGGYTLSDIRTKTLQHIAEHGDLAFIVVDYLGLVRPSGKKGQTRQQELGEITRGLKALSSEIHADVIMLAQLNRGIEGRESAIPTLSDLREAGDIENDSNIVLFVINPEKFDPNTQDKGKGIIYVSKHRGGKTGKTELMFNASLTRFDPLERYRTVEGYGTEPYTPAVPVSDMVARIKSNGARVLSGAELNRALADSTDTTFSPFMPMEDDDAFEG
jgi:replicative DNA helicase